MAVHVSRFMKERIIDAYAHLRILLGKIVKTVSSMKALNWPPYTSALWVRPKSPRTEG